MSRSVASLHRNRRALNELGLAQKKTRRAEFEEEFKESLRRMWSATNTGSRIELTEKFIDLIHRIAVSDIELWPFKDLLFTGHAFNRLILLRSVLRLRRSLPRRWRFMPSRHDVRCGFITGTVKANHLTSR